MTRWMLVAALAVALAGGVQAADEGASSAEGTQTTPVEAAPPGPDDQGDAGSASDEAGTDTEEGAAEEAEPKD